MRHCLHQRADSRAVRVIDLIAPYIVLMLPLVVVTAPVFPAVRRVNDRASAYWAEQKNRGY